MDSINKQQPEDNKKSLAGKEAVEKIKLLAEKAETCLFCTDIRTGEGFKTRPMAVQKVDDAGNLWFLSADDSHKNMDLASNPGVQLLFQGSHHSDFLSIYGRGVISKDKEMIKELWSPMVKNWFTGGEDDSRITVIKVEPKEGYYWDTKHGNMVAFFKIIAGTILGKTLDDSIEGKINV